MWPFSRSNQWRRHWVDIVHSPSAAWAILFASLIITIIAWYLANRYADERIKQRFEFRVEESQLAIKNRMQEYEQMLRGGLGLFKSSNKVSRDEWRTYVETLDIDHRWPGVQGVGYSMWIAPKNRARVIKQVRAEGFPEFTIKPEGERDVYTAILYLEPFAGRNLRAFGFDMYSEPTRRAAMQRAIDTGEAALSGRVTLVQETNKDVQAGFLMYLPYYRKPSTTVPERRENIVGFIYSPFRIRDLMHGILGGGQRDVNFEIYDGDAVNKDKLLYLSTPKDVTLKKETPQFTKTATFSIAGNAWTIRYATTSEFEQDADTSQPTLVAAGGALIDILLFYIVLSLARLRQRAQGLAEDMIQKLGEQQLHFKSIADTANDGIISADHTGNISYFNNAAQKIFGYQTQEILGKPLSILMPERYRERHRAGFRRLYTSGHLNSAGAILEMQGLRKNGEEFPLEISLSHWVSKGEHHTNAVLRDISERKKVDRMKSEFISTVSHELRTPLTAIRGALGLIVATDKSAGQSQPSQLLTIANANIERLGRLINDLLDVEKLESSELRLDSRIHALPDLLRTALQHHEAAAAQAGVKLILKDCAPLSVQVDADRFQQIVANLLSNAVKFSPANGRVEIAVEPHAAQVQISVSDEGPGIPADFHTRIFQKFAQADSSDSRAKGGTGLGLSICKSLVERMGGTIGFENRAEGGTRIYFTVPIADDQTVVMKKPA